MSEDVAASEKRRLSVFVLTIDPEGGLRRTNALQQLARVGLNGRFVQGFKKNDPVIFAEYDSTRNLLVSKRNLTHGEMAVYCGHRAIWREFLKSGKEVALVLEDDFQIVDVTAFMEALEDSLAHQEEWGLLKLFDFEPKAIKKRKRIGRTELVKHKYVAAGAVAYLIHRDVARRLLARKRFFRQIDEDFAWEWEHNLNAWSVHPSCVADGGDALGGSLLDNDRVRIARKRKAMRSLWANVIQGYKLVRSLTR